jgi:hypothetical protein
MSYTFQLQQLQTGLFTPGVNVSKPLDVAQGLISSTGALFDGQPIILPIPPDAPPELPRIIVRNSSGTYTCNVSKNRIDFIFTDKAMAPSLKDKSEEFLNYLLSLVDFLKSTLRTIINRIGTIASLVLPLNESSNKFISEKFLREHLFDSTYEIQLGVLKKIQLTGYKANCWFRLNTLRNTKDISDDRAMLITFDVNTEPEVTYELNKDQVGIFFNSAVKYIEENLKIYFIE